MTENTTYFLFIALIFAVISPPPIAAQAWPVLYGVARIGYTYSYPVRKDDARRLIMSPSLLEIYSMTTYLAMSRVV